MNGYKRTRIIKHSEQNERKKPELISYSEQNERKKTLHQSYEQKNLSIRGKIISVPINLVKLEKKTLVYEYLMKKHYILVTLVKRIKIRIDKSFSSA